jgi:hypothetical protein
MTPYYLAPACTLSLVLAARNGTRALRSTLVLVAGVTLFAYCRCGPWVWWTVVVAALVALLVVCRPPAVPAGADGEVRRDVDTGADDCGGDDANRGDLLTVV